MVFIIENLLYIVDDNTHTHTLINYVDKKGESFSKNEKKNCGNIYWPEECPLR